MVKAFVSQKGKDLVSFTDSALHHFKKQLELSKDNAISINVKKSGCSGLTYVITSTSNAPSGFIKIKAEGVLFYLNPQAVKYIRGLKIDHINDKLGLSKLIYNNPNESARCGCGESFSIHQEKD